MLDTPLRERGFVKQQRRAVVPLRQRSLALLSDCYFLSICNEYVFTNTQSSWFATVNCRDTSALNELFVPSKAERANCNNALVPDGKHIHILVYLFIEGHQSRRITAE